jgi:hypothetical protein
MVLYQRGLPWGLKNVESGKLRLVDFVITIKYYRRFGRRGNFNADRLIGANRSIQQVAVYIAKRQLLILLKVVGNGNGAEIMDINKCAETHAGVGHTMLLKVLH